jgi:hypothetical protein
MRTMIVVGQLNSLGSLCVCFVVNGQLLNSVNTVCCGLWVLK